MIIGNQECFFYKFLVTMKDLSGNKGLAFLSTGRVIRKLNSGHPEADTLLKNLLIFKFINDMGDFSHCTKAGLFRRYCTRTAGSGDQF